MSLITQEVKDFLKAVPPFQFLDEGELDMVARGVSVEYYPKGTAILTEDGGPSRYLSVVKKGGVKVSAGSGGEDIVMDYRGEGDSFGFISLISGDRARLNITALDDTLCYQVERAAVLKLMDTNPAFMEYYLKSFLIKSIDRTYKEMHERGLYYGGGDKLLFTTQVGELITKEAVTDSEDVSIKDAAVKMTKNNISSLVLLNADGMPSGIVTDKDMRSKVTAKERDVSGPVRDIMSVSLVRADAHEFCFEALLKMVRYGIHHLVVVEGGRLRGVVTNHDFMLLQGTSPVSVAREIESRHTIEELAAASIKVNRIISLLVKDGARAGNITRIISEINDRVVRQALRIVEKRHGRPPVAYCWVGLGSEGRKEQTFRTDQDNAIIYADPADEAQAEAARAYFASFARDAADALVRCGFPACPADYMAMNPRWCQPLKAWKEYFKDWINNPTPEAVMSSLVMFDFRHVYGEAALAGTLRDYLVSKLDDQKVFLGFMANQIISNRPPVGFFKTFVVEKGGEHKDELNLKIKGVAPLVDALRLFALEKGVKETSTLERLHALKDRHTIVGEYAEELEQAFEFISYLRIYHQAGQIEMGVRPDNFINPDRLSGLEKKTIKEAFRVISTVQEQIIERYKQMIW
ncbi:MAG: cyclic nucleotide-binding/CBS domain-containing protein [Nitrospirae bacterium]|nr:cyclic nucleotide-binding/CBS domain-containing protein [Nitrospirota bacterium]